jgi:hypothetical protein
LLTLTQECQGHDLAVRKFQRIVMGRHPVFVDLPKVPKSRVVSLSPTFAKSRPAAIAHLNELFDETLKETFPASDPIAIRIYRERK